MNQFLLGAAALAVAVPSMAQVQAPLAPRAPMAPRADMTQTRDQVVAKVRTRFERMDANRDGFVAGDEVRAQRGQRGQRLAMGGGNRMAGHGGAMRDPSAMFDRLDANRDGMISRDEFGRGHQGRTVRRIVIERAPGAAGAGEHRGMRKIQRMGGGARMLRVADLNKDGRVSLQEATASALQRFDRVDANRDGRITPDERRQNRELRRQSRAPRAG